MKPITKTLAAVLLLTASTAVLAQQTRVYRDGGTWVEETTGTLAAAKNVKVATDAGAVRVTGSSQNEITYIIRKRSQAGSEEAARRDFERLTVWAGIQGDTAVVRGTAQHGNFHFSADFEVRTPRNTALVIAHTGGGSVNFNNLGGRVEAQTGGGSINADDIGGPLLAHSGGGSVNIGRVGGELNTTTGGGSIHVQSVDGAITAHSGGGSIQIDSGKQSMDLETGGGSINVNTCASDLRASTGGGTINIGSVGGKAVLETGGGGIRLASANGPVKAESGGGSIALYKMARGAQVETGGGGIIAEFVTSPGKFSDSHLESGAGDITVYIPEDLQARVDAAIEVANGHKIYSEFEALKVTSEGGAWGPKEVFCQGSLNGGGPALKVHTSTGNIELKKTSLSARDRNR